MKVFYYEKNRNQNVTIMQNRRSKNLKLENGDNNWN